MNPPSAQLSILTSDQVVLINYLTLIKIPFFSDLIKLAPKDDDQLIDLSNTGLISRVLNVLLSYINFDDDGCATGSEVTSDSGCGDACANQPLETKESLLSAKSDAELGCIISASHFLGMIELYNRSLDILSSRLNAMQPTKLSAFLAL